jgi:phospholipid/cholesterol/gamma-HCH transport system permease protein
LTLAPRDAGWRVSRAGDEAVIVLDGDWRERRAEPPARLAAAFDAAVGNAGTICFDTAALSGWNSLLVATLWRLRARHEAEGAARLVEDGLPPALRRLLALSRQPHNETGNDERRGTASRRRLLGLPQVGDRTLRALAAVGETAELFIALLGSLRPRRRERGAGMQKRDLLDAFCDTGPLALPIIGLVMLLVGAILAFIGAAQLRRFGAQAFISNLVGLALVRELGAVITAIVLSGRTGGAYAARLATMQSNEEIDALLVLGIDPRRFLVLPMTLALVLAMPLLYLYATAAGLLGGLLVATNLLDLSAETFCEQLVQVVPFGQFLFGGFKSVLFGLLIGLVSCRIGLRAQRSAAAVGTAATRAVVASIVGVIVVDSICAVCADAIGV